MASLGLAVVGLGGGDVLHKDDNVKVKSKVSPADHFQAGFHFDFNPAQFPKVKNLFTYHFRHHSQPTNHFFEQTHFLILSLALLKNT